MRSRRSCRSLDTAVCPLLLSNRVMRLMPNRRAYIAASRAASTFSLPASRSRPEPYHQAHDDVGYGGRGSPGETEPKGREDHSKYGESRVVGHEGEAVEPPWMMMLTVIRTMSMALSPNPPKR